MGFAVVAGRGTSVSYYSQAATIIQFFKTTPQGATAGRWIFLCALVWFAIPNSYAQTATLRGFVTDAADGEVLQGVNVVLRNESGAFWGTSSVADGYFILNRIAAGRYMLEATYVGYVAFQDTLVFAEGEQKTRAIALTPGEEALDEVVVESEGVGGAVVTAGLQTIRPKEMERVPLPDVSGDLMGYLQTLPGMLTPGDRGGQLFVRGGTPSQNLVLLDGIPIYQPFHIIGFFSAFPADIIHHADVYSGGFGASYGGRLSSVIDVVTRHGDKQRFQGRASVAPFLSALQVEGPLYRGKVSVMASVRESLVERLAPSVWSGALPFRFGDEMFKLHASLNDRSQLSVTALHTHDRGLVDDTERQKTESILADIPEDLPDEEASWENAAIGLRYLVLPSEVPVLGEVTLSLSNLSNTFGPRKEPERDANVQTIRYAAAVTHFLGATTVKWGAALQNVQLNYNLNGIFQELDVSEETITDAGFFVEADAPLGSHFRLNPGLHLHTFATGDVKTTIEPRLRAVWYPGGEEGWHQVSGAWGLYAQNLIGLQDERDAGEVFTAWLPSPVGDGVPSAMHAILGWQMRPRPWLKGGIEGYYKTLSNLAIPAWNAFPRFTTTLQPAHGTVSGLDVRLEIERPSYYLYLGYGLARVLYTAQQESFGVWYGVAQQEFNPPHDRRHQFNALGSFTVGPLMLNVRWQFGSGLPYTRPFGFDDWILFESLVDVTKEPGQYRVLFDRPYQGRLPTYHRLDISVEHVFTLPHAKLTVQAGVINAYDRRNLFYFDVWTLRRVDQFPFTPSFGLKIETL